jgi:hypothetical protein
MDASLSERLRLFRGDPFAQYQFHIRMQRSKLGKNGGQKLIRCCADKADPEPPHLPARHSSTPN